MMIEFGDSRLSQRFWARVSKNEADCWLWTGALMGSRRIYGFYSPMKSSPHRLVLQVEAPIPQGMHVDHLCRVPLCCNPAHLEIVTPQENVRRQFAHVTHCKHGHEFTPENTNIRDNGTRQCRECVRIRNRKVTIAQAAARRAERARNPLPPKPSSMRAPTGGLRAYEIQAAKTECAKGHPYTEDNTYRKPTGHRDCRACIRERVRIYRSRKVTS